MKIYCAGIGGIGLSAYAALQRAAGHEVLGSDRVESAVTKDLQGQGIEVFYEQDGSHVPEDCDLFVYSEAIPKDALERQKAEEFGIEQESYFQALGTISKDSFVIAVCGTHGKSSTTSMLAKVLTDAGKDPTVVVGTKVPDLDGRNWRKGESDLFLLEACEYRRSFHYLSPNIVLMTNVDGDHFDAYPGGVEEYQQAFADFLALLPEDGIIITYLSDPACRRLAGQSGRRVIDADQEQMPELSVPGRHMQQNAQLALSLAKELGIAEDTALNALKQYKGCWRRMELKGTYHDIPVIDDYGHHPKEVRATLSAVKEAYPGKRIVCVFQPHTHDRTLKFYDEFTVAFADANIVIIPNIYDARSDIETDSVDTATLVNDIARESEVETIEGHSLEGVERLLQENILQKDDVLLCMGAGDIANLATSMVT